MSRRFRRLLMLALAGIPIAALAAPAIQKVPQFFQSKVVFMPQAFTVADSGNGSAATGTLTPASGYVALTCSDSDGCTITMSETGAIDGTIVRIVNVSANAATFADTSGVSETAGSFAMGQWDALTLVYASDRWVELARSNN